MCTYVYRSTSIEYFAATLTARLWKSLRQKVSSPQPPPIEFRPFYSNLSSHTHPVLPFGGEIIAPGTRADERLPSPPTDTLCVLYLSFLSPHASPIKCAPKASNQSNDERSKITYTHSPPLLRTLTCAQCLQIKRVELICKRLLRQR